MLRSRDNYRHYNNNMKYKPCDNPLVLKKFVQNGGYGNLSKAIREGDIDTVVRLLVDTDINSIRPDLYNLTPLIYASSIGNLEVVQWLIDHGANVNTPTVTGETALMLAYKYVGILEYLLNHGANVDDRDSTGRTPLMYAVSRGGVSSVFSRWRKCYQPRWPGNIECAQLLLSRGADIHAIDNNGKPVLMYAISTDYIEAVNLLIDVGVDVNVGDRDRKTPLMYAIYNDMADDVCFKYRDEKIYRSNFSNIVRLLIDQGDVYKRQQ